MVETINLIILLLPIPPLVVLWVANSDAQRRNGFFALGGELFLLFIWALLINLIMRGDANQYLFKGAVGAVLNFLFYNLWALAGYGLLIAIAGHVAHRHSLKKNRGRNI